MQLRCKRKIYKEKYKMFARDSQMLRNKRNFVISVIVITVFYCTQKPSVVCLVYALVNRNSENALETTIDPSAREVTYAKTKTTVVNNNKHIYIPILDVHYYNGD